MCFCICIVSAVFWAFGTVGPGPVAKLKQHSRLHKVSQTRKPTANRHEKIQYERSMITDDDVAQFAACQTKAAEVCTLWLIVTHVVVICYCCCLPCQKLHQLSCIEISYENVLIVTLY